MITREFVLAGRAIFTVANNKGEWYTFKVRSDREGNWKAFVLAGPDNTSSFKYVGKLNDETGRLIGVYSVKDTVARVLNWAIGVIWTQSSLPQGYTIKHSGRCGRCGRLLTTPESIDSGLGPKCLARESK